MEENKCEDLLKHEDTNRPQDYESIMVLKTSQLVWNIWLPETRTSVLLIISYFIDFYIYCGHFKFRERFYLSVYSYTQVEYYKVKGYLLMPRQHRVLIFFVSKQCTLETSDYILS